MRKNVGLVVLAVILTACGGDPMTHGTVTGGDYQPDMTIPITNMVCTGSPSVCTPIVTMQFVPEHWLLNLDDGSRKGSIEVSRDTYDRCLIGERYPLCGQPGEGDTRQ